MAAVERDKHKVEALKAAVLAIEKNYGKGAITTLGAHGTMDVPCIPTGIPSLDAAMGGRGVPRGRVAEFWGNEACGKTTLCLQIIANAQRSGGSAAFIDAEHALDPTYVKALGVDLDSLLISQPDYGEQALEIADQLSRSGAVDIIVIDSVAALVPKAELEGDMGDAVMGGQARMMAQALRKLTATLGRTQTTIIFTNQTREKIGVMFGNPETTPGGRALKFFASMRVNLKFIGAIKDGDQRIGGRVKIDVVKNKIAPPYGHTEVDLLAGTGFSRDADLVDEGVLRGVLTKQGAWISFQGTKLGNGRDMAKAFLKENQDVAAAIEAELRKTAAAKAAGGTGAATAPAA